MLSNWENRFLSKLQRLNDDKLKTAGVLLSVIPSHSDWDKFLDDVRSEWDTWRNNPRKYPHCLVILFGGIAFYEYEDNTFWPQFATAVGENRIDTNEQVTITSVYSQAVRDIGLSILEREAGKLVVRSGGEIKTGLQKLIGTSRSEHVGSAVYQIGIPLSLWSGFLEICEWALWREDWADLSENEWTESVGKRAGGRQRLKRFLSDNREIASTFIKEMLDARNILSNDTTISISELSQASLLRQEYFEEIPETADFLRPQDPESLFKDRARLVWKDQDNCISLYLPGVEQNKLPATWEVENVNESASSTHGEIILNSLAFQKNIELKIKSGEQTDMQRLQGVYPWGLFDSERNGYWVNSNREQLPLRSYTLVSPQKLEGLSFEGFDETESPINEPFQLSDGGECFVTRLWPREKFAILKLGSRQYHFRARSQIDARLFLGQGFHAAFFERIQDKLKVQHLRTLYLFAFIPTGYFRDVEQTLNAKFRVLLDERIADGRWQKTNRLADEDGEIFYWQWDDKPFMEKRKSGKAKDFHELKDFFRSPDLKGDHVLSVQSQVFEKHYKIYLDHSKPGMSENWKNLPGAFLPWFLLCQSSEGMRWDDLLLARDVIAPDQSITYYFLRKYMQQGLLQQKGHLWMIAQSRGVLKPIDDEKLLLEYCGDPSILWSLYRKMYHISPNSSLPVIEVISGRGEIPFLQMTWHQSLWGEIRKYLRSKNVVLRQELWNH